MTATTDAPEATPADDVDAANDGGDRPDRRLTPRRALVVFAVLAMTAFWIYALAMDGRIKPAGYLADQTFSNTAEPICAAAVRDLRQLPEAHLAKNPIERAAVIDRATVRLETMLADLRKAVPATADAKWINTWLDDWQIHIGDRNDFVHRLRTVGRSAEFLETQKAGTQISNSLTHYAEINHMESCGPPGDV